MAGCFVYMAAIMAWHSHKVLSLREPNTLDASFCVNALEEAIEIYGAPEFFDTEQENQLISEDFTGVLKWHGIQINMDGKGRRGDNLSNAWGPFLYLFRNYHRCTH